METIEVRTGDPSDNVPGKTIVIPEVPEQVRAKDFDLTRMRRSYVRNALQHAPDGYDLTPEDVVFLAEDTNTSPATVEEIGKMSGSFGNAYIVVEGNTDGSRKGVDPADILMFHIHCGPPGGLGPEVVNGLRRAKREAAGRMLPGPPLKPWAAIGRGLRVAVNFGGVLPLPGRSGVGDVGRAWASGRLGRLASQAQRVSGSCPGAWCKKRQQKRSAGHRLRFGRRASQAATADRLTLGLSPTSASVSSVM